MQGIEILTCLAWQEIETSFETNEFFFDFLDVDTWIV